MKAEAGLQALQDDELFLVDEGPPSTDVIPIRGIEHYFSEGDDDEEDLPAWQDSHDEILTVKLATTGLLSDLRI